MINTTVDPKHAKFFLPSQLKFPLPDETVDALITTQEIAIHLPEDDDVDTTNNHNYALLAALIELKELRAKKDNVLNDQAQKDLYRLYKEEVAYSTTTKQWFFWSVLECIGCEEEFKRYKESREC